MGNGDTTSRRRSLDAHGKSIAVGESAADYDAGRERVLGDLHGVAGALLVKAGEGDVGILLHGAADHVAQGHGMNCSGRGGTESQQKDCSIQHVLIVMVMLQR